MPSSPVAAQNTLVDLLQALETFETAHVTFGGTAKLPKTMEVVWVEPVRNYRKEPGEAGFEIETYDLVLRIEVFRTGDEGGLDADPRRWDLIDAVEAELRRVDYLGFDTKGGAVTVVESALDPYDKGWIASSTVTFGVETWQ